MHIISGLICDCEAAANLDTMNPFNVLSVGCGPAFELQNIFTSQRDCDRFHFTLFDQDSAALSEAAELLGGIERKIGAQPRIDLVQGSVRTMLFSRKVSDRWGKFDFIYSLGLFDYLEIRVARAVFNRLFNLLKPGGVLIVGNFHVSNPSRYYMGYWGDWVLLHRTEEDLKSLLQNNPVRKASIRYDATKTQMLLNVEKENTTQ